MRRAFGPKAKTRPDLRLERVRYTDLCCNPLITQAVIVGKLCAIHARHPTIHGAYAREILRLEQTGGDAGTIAAAADCDDWGSFWQFFGMGCQFSKRDMYGSGDVAAGPFRVAAHVKNKTAGVSPGNLFGGELGGSRELHARIHPSGHTFLEKSFDVFQAHSGERAARLVIVLLVAYKD